MMNAVPLLEAYNDLMRACIAPRDEAERVASEEMARAMMAACLNAIAQEEADEG